MSIINGQVSICGNGVGTITDFDSRVDTKSLDCENF